MKRLSRFVAKFTSLIVAVLSCFDRVLFKGHLALAAPRELESFVDCVLKVRRSDFMKTMAPQYSDRLVEHAQGWARKASRTYEYRTGQFRKDEWAQKLIRDEGIFEGLVGSRTFTDGNQEVVVFHRIRRREGAVVGEGVDFRHVAAEGAEDVGAELDAFRG